MLLNNELDDILNKSIESKSNRRVTREVKNKIIIKMILYTKMYRY